MDVLVDDIPQPPATETAVVWGTPGATGLPLRLVSHTNIRDGADYPSTCSLFLLSLM